MELDFFEGCSEESVHSSTYQTIHNNEISSTSSSSQYIFRCAPSVHWRNFANSHFEIVVKLVKGDDTALADLEVSTINGLGMGLLKSFDLFVGDTRVLTHELHNYTSYFENRWSIGAEAAGTWPALFGWFEDQHGQFDTFTDVGNSGFKARRGLLKNDWDVTLYSKPKVFPFTVAKLFPPDLDFRFEVERSPDSFMLLAANGVAPAKLIVKKISLVLENVVVPPPIEHSLLSRISSDGALYEFTQVKMQSYFIPKDVTVFELAHHKLIWPKMPEILLMSIVSEKAFIGDIETNPYSFKPCNVTEIQIKINGSDLYFPSLKCDFTKADYSSAYKEILSTLDYMYSDKRAPTVSYHAFDNDNVFFASNIARKFPETIDSPSGSQELSIVFTFSAATTENQRLLVYPTYKNAALVSGSASDRAMKLLYN